MKKIIAAALSVFMAAPLLSVPIFAAADKTETVSYNYEYDRNDGYSAQNALTRQMEKLGRGLIAVKSGSGVYLSWRLLDSEDHRYGSAQSNVSFNVYRGSEKIATVFDSTNYTDQTAGSSYSVAPVIGGVEGERCGAVSVWNNGYIEIPLVKPDAETIEYVHPYTPTDSDGKPYTDGNGNIITYTDATYSFSPTDCSAGDLDGDGEYEIVVKWVSSERDVGSPGTPEYSGTVHLAAYKLDGRKMWSNDIELGKNVYSSVHTVQFLVYDFDGDGKAEITSQTSLGSKDAAGEYVSHAAKSDAVASTGTKIADFTDEDNETADFRDWGRVRIGEEFLTIFSGETGRALDTIDYPTARVNYRTFVNIKDDGGNRSLRFLADIAYLDGEKPYAVYWRGYYDRGTGRTGIAGVSFDGERMSVDYVFDTLNGQPGYLPDSEKYYTGQGNHSMICADVDNDGRDEIISGALCMEATGNQASNSDAKQLGVKWCTFREHGDAHHIGDYDPTVPGLEYFTVHEHGGVSVTTDTGYNKNLDYGVTVIQASDGTELFHKGSGSDTGRGVMANVGAGGYYQISAAGNMRFKSDGGDAVSSISTDIGTNFRVFWDGDLYDEGLNGTTVSYWNGSKMANYSIAGMNGCVSVNGSKSTPSLTADLFGDWREELVYPTSDGSALRVFTTTTPTEYKIKTLMHDPVYRNGVAAEQTAYNQPPHVGFYMGEEIFKEKPVKIEIVSLPNRTTFAQGQTLSSEGLTVRATYENGTSEDVSSYTISGYDANKLGTQTITVKYLGKTAEYDINVVAPSIKAIESAYTTASSSADVIPIGSYYGAFTIEHTVTINSMPANGSTDRNSTAGFFMRMSPPDGTGGGWYLTADGTNKAKVIWKSTSTNTITKTSLNIGETYTFRYNIVNAGFPAGVDENGSPVYSGATVSLTITNASGTVMGSGSGLGLRNMTNDKQKSSPLGVIEIYNQAKNNSAANVVIGSASLTLDQSITPVSDTSFSVTLGGSPEKTADVIAAKYDKGVLTNMKRVKAELGANSVTFDFAPDKVFVWNGMQPINIWTK